MKKKWSGSRSNETDISIYFYNSIFLYFSIFLSLYFRCGWAGKRWPSALLRRSKTFRARPKGSTAKVSSVFFVINQYHSINQWPVPNPTIDLSIVSRQSKVILVIFSQKTKTFRVCFKTVLNQWCNPLACFVPMPGLRLNSLLQKLAKM